MSEARRNLGWANGDPELFKQYRICCEAKHAVGDKNLDRTNHGYDTLYFCDTCGYEFHCDSSG